MTTLLWIAIGLLLLAAGFHLAVHFGFRAKRIPEQGDPARFGLPFEEVAIPAGRRKPLFGWWVPAQNSSRSLVLIHGWGSNAELMLPLAVPLHGAAWNLLLFDARNHGRSPSASFSSMPRFAEDLDAAIRWLKTSRPQAARSLAVIGHSVGAAAALLSASRRNDLTAVVSISAFAHPQWLTERYLRRVRIPQLGIRLTSGYVQWLIGHRFDAIAPITTICRIDCPVLIVHGGADRTIPLSDAESIATACPRAKVSLLILPEADHDSTEHIPAYSDQLLEFLCRSEEQPRMHPSRLLEPAENAASGHGAASSR